MIPYNFQILSHLRQILVSDSMKKVLYQREVSKNNDLIMNRVYSYYFQKIFDIYLLGDKDVCLLFKVRTGNT